MAALRYSSAPQTRALLHLTLGRVQQKNRRFGPAADHYDTAVSLLNDADDPWLLAQAWARQGSVRFAVGKWQEGELLCRRALATQRTLQPAGGLEEAETLNCLGLILGQKPELEEARALLESAIKLQQRLGDGRALAHSYIQLGVVYRMQRAYETADRLLERALEIFEDNQAPLPDRAFALVQRGKNAHWARDFDSATDYFQQALKSYQQARAGTAQLAALHERLGKMALESGDFETGHQQAQAALRLREEQVRVDGDLGATANSRALLGNYYEQKGQPRDALAEYSLALEVLREHADDFWIGYTQGAIARVQADLGNFEAARQASDQALAHYRRDRRTSFWLIEGLSERGLLEAKAGRPLVSLQWLQEAADMLEIQTAELGGSRQIQAGFRSEFHSVYHHILETQLELGAQESAFLTLERSLAQSFRAIVAEHAAVSGDRLPPALHARKEELQQYRDRIQYDLLDAKRRNDTDAIAHYEDETVDALLEYESFQRRVREHRQQTILDTQAPVLDLTAVRHSLDPGTLLISFSTLTHKTLVFSVSRDEGLDVHTLEIGSEEIEDRVDAFHKQISEARTSMPRQQQALRNLGPEALRLYQALLGPLQPRIDTARRILIVPDGQLHELPWSALQSSEDHFLIQDKQLHIAPSASAYAQLKNRHRPTATPVMLAAFGGPEYPQRLMDTDSNSLRNPQLRSVVERSFALQLLPYSELEVEGISRLFGSRSRAYLGAAATEEQAKLTTQARYLHFATHAIVDSRMPLHSALALSIPEQLEDGQENGLLEVWEILEGIQLKSTELVVLSSCKSALGKELSGEGMMGLTRAFHIAGARSVVASLWNVQDDSTAELMRRFYQHLDAGLPKAEALRQAQIELLRGDAGEASRTPFAWAAFQVYGDWR